MTRTDLGRSVHASPQHGVTVRRSIEVLLAAMVTGFVAFQVGSCGHDDVRRERDTAYKLANHYRWQRDSTAQAQAKTDTITRVVVQRDRVAEAQRDSLMAVLTYADSVFADTLSTMAALRLAYAVQRARVTQYVTAYDSLQASTRDLIAAHAEERFRTNRTLALADSSIAAWKGVADAERRGKWRMASCAAGGAGVGAWSGTQLGGPWGAVIGTLVGGFAGAATCN